MAERKLDLLERGAAFVRELAERSAQVVRPELHLELSNPLLRFLRRPQPTSMARSARSRLPLSVPASGSARSFSAWRTSR